MKLIQAIAYSTGNKAEGINDQAQPVIVQERYNDASDTWYHVWHLHRGEVTQTDIAKNNLGSLRQFEVDPDADYWMSVK